MPHTLAGHQTNKQYEEGFDPFCIYDVSRQPKVLTFWFNGKKIIRVVLADRILDFYRDISIPPLEDLNVEVLLPFNKEPVDKVMSSFYKKYFKDTHSRIMLIGINPGRFGGGVTGIPFTDPINLEAHCGISNPFERRYELSSNFIYDVISAYGGPAAFYSRYCFYSVSPIGFTREGKNFNYYDDKALKERLEDFIVSSMRSHLEMGMSSEIAFSLGQGTNIKELRELNEKYNFFKEILPLPHPRWVMQYRLKKKEFYINEYLKALHPSIKL